MKFRRECTCATDWKQKYKYGSFVFQSFNFLLSMPKDTPPAIRKKVHELWRNKILQKNICHRHLLARSTVSDLIKKLKANNSIVSTHCGRCGRNQLNQLTTSFLSDALLQSIQLQLRVNCNSQSVDSGKICLSELSNDICVIWGNLHTVQKSLQHGRNLSD